LTPSQQIYLVMLFTSQQNLSCYATVYKKLTMEFFSKQVSV